MAFLKLISVVCLLAFTLTLAAGQVLFKKVGLIMKGVSFLDGENPGRTAGSSIYPAVQNMLLATRALGLGTTLTTRHTGYGREVDAIFGLRSGVHPYAILPIGWPMAGSGRWAAARSKMSSIRTSGANPTRGFERASPHLCSRSRCL